MHKIRPFIAILMLVSASAFAESEAQMKQAAMHGDYQAQRNLAYSYANGWATPESPNYVPKKPVDACAWYRIIVTSKKAKPQPSDASNESIYCGRLTPEQNQNAWVLAKNISKKIAKK